MIFGRKVPLSTLIPVIFLLLATVVRLNEPVYIAESRLKVFDTYQRIKPRDSAEFPITIVDIDDLSLGKYGQWPWPRNILAELVDTLRENGAAVIVFDILFSEPDRISRSYLSDVLKIHLEDSRLKTILDLIPDNDQLLTQSISQSNVVLGFALTPNHGQPPEVQQWRVGSLGPSPQPYLLSFGGSISAIPTLQHAAAGQGYVSHTVDTDEVIRQLPLFVTINNKIYPSLAAETLRVAQGASTFIAAVSESDYINGLTSVKIGQLTVPTDSAGRIWIHYRDPKSMVHVPAWKVLSGKLNRELVEGRLILVGSTALGVGDFSINPLGILTSSVEIHAQALETILSDDYLHRPQFLMGLELLLCIVLGVLLIWLLPKFGMLWCGVLAFLAIFGTMTTGWIAFDRYNMLIDTIYPSAIIILIYISGSFSIYFTTRTRLIRTTWLVEHDVLTGSLSRRTWYDRAIKALDNCADRQRFLVAILDIDFFKKVNDTYGHITGDEALKHTVKILSKALGSDVSFGRLGGEEFGLNLEINSGASSPNGSIPKVATDLLDSVRAQLENTPLQIDDLKIPITISIGATFPKDSEVLNDAIDRADKALYNSKESGRNRVTLL